MSVLIPLKVESICGTGGVSSELILRSNSPDLLRIPFHFRSDHRDPGLDPGREGGREGLSLIRILGILRIDAAFDPRRSRRKKDCPSLTGGASPSFPLSFGGSREEAGR